METVFSVLLGLCAIFGSYRLALMENREGVQAASIMVIDEEHHFDDVAITDAINRVYFGRELDLAVYIGENPQPTNTQCEYNPEQCLSEVLPGFIDYYDRVRERAFIIWVDPVYKNVLILRDDLAFRDNAISAINDASEALSFLYLKDELTPERFTQAIQYVADAESGDIDNKSHFGAIIVALVAGIIVAILVYLALSGIVQARQRYRDAGVLGTLSKKERKAKLEYVRDVFTSASLQIDQHDSRWQRAYTNFARAMFAAASLSDRELVSLKYAPILAELLMCAEILEHDYADDSLWNELQPATAQSQESDFQLTHQGEQFAHDAAETVDTQQFKDLLGKRLASVQKAQPTSARLSLLRIPISPLAVVIAALVAIGVAIAYAGITAPVKPILTASDSVYRTMPTAVSSQSSDNGIPIIKSAGIEQLRGIENVTIVDNAHLFSSPQALREMTSEIPMPEKIALKIYTTDTKLTRINQYSCDETKLVEEFPQDFRKVGDIYVDPVVPDDNQLYVVLVYADSGNQHMIYSNISEYLLLNEYGKDETWFKWSPEDEFRRGTGTSETVLWNTLAAVSNALRGVEFSPAISTINSGMQSEHL